ncbi:hypothetical protein POD66_002436 [Enterococcus hirae]|nr:hypothetical protein [Enterococcus hirae]
MKAFKSLGYCVLAFVVFNVSMCTTAFIIDKGYENEQITSSTTQSNKTSSTIEETQTTTTETSHSNEPTQEEVTPKYTPANTDEYTVNKYMGYDPNIKGDSYSITRNSDGMEGVLTIDNQANMQWYYYDAEGIHTN